MLVFDTSAYINGWRDHYPPGTFPSVWDFITEAMGLGRIILPREVYRELLAKDDEIVEWAKERSAFSLDANPDVQRAVGPSTQSSRVLAVATAPTPS